MALSTMIANINKAREDYEKAKKAIGKSAQKEIGAMFADVIPEGFKLQWEQYTPYFNDGDACTFSVYDPKVVPDDEDEDEDGDCGVELSSYYIDKYGSDEAEWHKAIDGLLKADLKRIDRVWRSLPHDMLEQVFGDHVQIVITASGKVSVDEYSHD